MKHFKLVHLFIAATIGSATSAFAGAGTVTTAVVPLTANVTYSSAATSSRPALTTFIGYTVAVGNAGGNTINNIQFTGTTTVTNGSEAADFISADGAVCQPSANPAGAPLNARSITCTIGQLTAGQSNPTFAVFFKAPGQVGTTNPDNVQFSGITYYGEGAGGLDTSIPQNSTFPWSASAVALGTTNPTLVKSALPKNGGTLFTGDGGLSTPTSPFTTTAIVPPAPTYTTADISVAPLSAAENCDNFTPCYGTQITIPGTFSPYLKFVLRIDASNIKPGTKINGVVLYYQADPVTPGPFVPIGDCASPTTPSGNIGEPCIAGRTYYKNKSTPGWTTDLDGDFEWTILNTRNGGYKIS